MDLDDPLSTLQTPPPKRRRLVAIKPSPVRLSDLLVSFRARRLPTSARRMEGVNKERPAFARRPQKSNFSYAESEGSSPGAESHSNQFVDSPPALLRIEGSEDDVLQDGHPHDDEEDELNSNDVIHVAPRRTSTRELPNRLTRTKVSYATPKKKVPKKKGSRKSAKLTSDIFANSKSSKSKAPEVTERNKVRNDIAEKTKPKRDAFLIANKEYFLPVLPETSYIDKLQRLQDMDEDVETAVVSYTPLTSQPQGVTATMKLYQLDGLSFLVYMHQNGMASILGDEMGLGKTLQTLALFQWLKENEPTKGEHRPYLVVCPLSVLSSWMNEARRWVPDLHVVRLHGPKTEREKLKSDCRAAGKAAEIDVIVTTYETFVSEQAWFKRAFVWRYCVLDEGHKIKNEKSDVAHALQSMSAEYRLLLTGTPLQNNLREMWALLHWLYPEVFTFDTADGFGQAFNLSKGKVSTGFMDSARKLLELIMLRRMKNSPGVNLGLPPKEEILLYVPLTPMQRFWYTRFLTRVDMGVLEQLFKGAKAKEIQSLQQEVEEDKKSGLLADKLSNAADADDVWAESRDIIEKAVQNEEIDNSRTSEWRKLMNLVLQLRKVCSHPYVFSSAKPDPYYLGEHVKTASGKFIVLDKLIDELVLHQRKKILIFAGFTETLNLCEDLLTMKGANALSDASFHYLRLDGGTSRARRNLGIRMFNEPNSDFKVMLISTRAGGLGINLASASDVVFMDEDWNPQITIQAEARAHRIGQTQKVTVYKLCTQGTVEEQMLGRIRKKLYLSAKITESMRTTYSDAQPKKRKRGPSSDGLEDDAPQLDAGSLKSLIRRGAQTLSRPEVDVTEMLKWDWATTLEKCKDRPMDTNPSNDGYDANARDPDEQAWLNSMEKVECAVFEGKKHQKDIDKATKGSSVELDRADRRAGKNTTVMIDGFAVNKESLNCDVWEAVPTMAGKDPRLAEPVKEKKAAIRSQDYCQHCWDGGTVVTCSGCPRSYHIKCLDKAFQFKIKGGLNFYCPQHECVDCQAKTQDAGGLIYRCRWCENGYCEDCLDWDSVKLIGENLPEYEMLGYPSKDNAWYIECHACMKHWETNNDDLAIVEQERQRIEKDYEMFLSATSGVGSDDITPQTISEVGTPVAMDFGSFGPLAEKAKLF